MDFKGAQMQPMGHLKSIVICHVFCFLYILSKITNVSNKTNTIHINTHTVKQKTRTNHSKPLTHIFDDDA